ncbi:glycerophosphodiester phosphodiesterase [Parablautia sp. Marseille-Q6255]|uniref:glycerophosphodiester phosphodiesterase n=1 Tax=Parablautia sp. Marseille-Q6255 TaxID=3039593 RepID=UPI0024BD22B7|nr:glycerophosphodiester phosphodiesterase [Parablautia sp. Marseille-Q6255]
MDRTAETKGASPLDAARGSWYNTGYQKERDGSLKLKNEAGIALGASFVYLLAIMPGHRRVRNAVKGKFYAHRGLHDRKAGIPENTMAAFRRAVERGFGIELDVQLTRDGEVVVFHDFDLKRICSVEGEVSDFTYKELRALSVDGTSEHIPKLSEVLEMVNGRVPLLVELKYKGMDSRICERTDAVMQRYRGDYAIESFHPRALWWYRRHRPEICRGQLAMNFQRQEGNYHLAYLMVRHLLFNFLGRPDFIAYDIRDRQAVSKNICRRIFGCPSAAWTVRSDRQLREVKQYYDSFIFEGFLPAQGEA